jgi:hypothetical protein
VTPELFLGGVCFGLLLTTCSSVYWAMKAKLEQIQKAHTTHIGFLEDEVQRLTGEVRRMSTHPPPRKSLTPPSMPPIELPGGSIVPPPPAYLFELAKAPAVLESSIPPPPLSMSPISQRLSQIRSRSSLRPATQDTLATKPSIPPPPPVPLAASFGQFEDSWCEPSPPTLRSDKSAVIAESLRPPAPAP